MMKSETTHFISNETSLKISDNKNLLFRTRKNRTTDLTEYYDLIYQYKMDCLVAAIEYNKDYYRDGDLKPEESISFSVTIMPFDNTLNMPKSINNENLINFLKSSILIFLSFLFSRFI